MEFAREINKRLCVYSTGLRHVYGDYSIELVHYRETKLVVVPSTYSADRYIDVDEESIKSTGVYIYPGWYFNLEVPYVMTIPIRTKDGVQRTRPLSPDHGFKLLERSFLKRPFYPIIKNGDLREFDQKAPYLHLHRIEPTQLGSLSKFDLDQLCRSIVNKRSKLTAAAV